MLSVAALGCSSAWAFPALKREVEADDSRPQDLDDELLEPWEYPSASLWYGDYRSAEQSLALIQVRWRRARIMNEKGEMTRADLKQLEASYLAVRTTLMAQRGLVEADLRELNRALSDARGELSLSSEDKTIRSSALEALNTQVDDAMYRADQATRSAMSLLVAAGREAAPAREAFKIWWALHLEVGRASHLVEPGGKDLAKLDNARQGLKVATQGLPDASVGLVDAALRAADEEMALRQSRLVLLTRMRDPDDSYHQGHLLQRINELEQARLQRQNRLVELDDAIDRVDRDLAGLDLDAPPTPEEAAFDALKTEVMTLRTTYDKLYLAMPTLQSHIDMDAWCAVHVHAAMVRTMLGEDGAPGLLLNAAAAYGGTCEKLMADQLEVPAFAALWAAALLRLHLAEPAQLQVDLGPGVWTLDGTPLVGGGAAVFTVAPGLHRLEYNQDRRVISSTERIDPGDRVCVGLNLQEKVQVDGCPIGTADPLFPTRTPHSAQIGPLDEPYEAPRPRTYAVAGGQWIRFPGPDEAPLDMLGGSLELGWRLGRSPKSMVHLAFQQDVARSPVEMALSGTLSSEVFLRERLAVQLIPDGTIFSPVVELGAGFVVLFPTDADDAGMEGPPLLLHAGLGVQIRLSEHLGFVSSVSGVQTFLFEETFRPLPSFRLGLMRWM